MLIHSIPHFKGLLDHVPKETKYKHLWDQGFPRSGAVLPSRKSILLLLMCPELPGQPGPPSLGCLQPKPISRLEKWLWGQVSHHFRALFSLLLQAQERTENPSRCRGRLQTNVFCSSSGVWEVRCPKKRPSSISPSLQAAPGMRTQEFPAMEVAQPHPKHFSRSF